MSRTFQASLGLNLVLAVTTLTLVLHKSISMPAPPAPEAAMVKAADEAPNLVSRPQPPQYKDIASAQNRRRWLVDQLRAAGVPDDVLARVVMSDLEEDWQKRFEESADKGHGDADAMAALQMEHDRTEDAEMRAARSETRASGFGTRKNN